jgi:disulfide bond formation protein DsbB
MIISTIFINIIVCTSVGIILILDISHVIHFINDTGKVVSSMCLSNLKILHAERLFLDKHDRVWIKGKHEGETHDEEWYILPRHVFRDLLW